MIRSSQLSIWLHFNFVNYLLFLPSCRPSPKSVGEEVVRSEPWRQHSIHLSNFISIWITPMLQILKPMFVNRDRNTLLVEDYVKNLPVIRSISVSFICPFDVYQMLHPYSDNSKSGNMQAFKYLDRQVMDISTYHASR